MAKSGEGVRIVGLAEKVEMIEVDKEVRMQQVVNGWKSEPQASET